jgi:hypothetical protein
MMKNAQLMRNFTVCAVQQTLSRPSNQTVRNESSVEDTEGRGPLGNSRSRFQNNIKTDLKIRFEGVNWTHAAQDRILWQALVKMVTNFGYHRTREYL